MLDIELNGEARQVADGSTLDDLVGQLALAGQVVALAVNRAVVPRQRWNSTILQAHDKVDVVRAIGGG